MHVLGFSFVIIKIGDAIPNRDCHKSVNYTKLSAAFVTVF